MNIVERTERYLISWLLKLHFQIPIKLVKFRTVNVLNKLFIGYKHKEREVVKSNRCLFGTRLTRHNWFTLFLFN